MSNYERPALSLGTALESFQPKNVDLSAIAALSPSNGQVLKRAGGVWTAAALTGSDLPAPLIFGTAGADDARVNINPDSAQVGLKLRAPASSPGNLTEWQNSSGTPIIVIDSAGRLLMNTTRSAGAGQFNSSPVAGTGTVSSSGTTVTGSGTLFNSEAASQGYIFAAGQGRRVVNVNTNTNITVDEAFSPPLDAGTTYTLTKPILILDAAEGIGVERFPESDVSISTRRSIRVVAAANSAFVYLGSGSTTYLRRDENEFWMSSDVGTNSLLRFRANASDKFQIGDNYIRAIAPFGLPDTGTASVIDAMIFDHQLTGSNVGADGIGVGVRFRAKSSTTASQEIGRIRATFPTATHGSRLGALIFSTYTAGTEVDMLTITPNGISTTRTLDPSTTAKPLFSISATYSGNANVQGNTALTVGVGISASAFVDNRTIYGATFRTVYNPASAVNAPAGSPITGIWVVGQNDSGRTTGRVIAAILDVIASRASSVITTAESILTRIIAGTSTTITDAYHIHLTNASNTGTLTRQYGLYVDALTAGETNYAIYTNGGIVRFGDKVFLANISAPSDTPSGGGYLFVEGGALKYKGSGGTVTELAAA